MIKHICDLCEKEIEGVPHKLILALFHYSIQDGIRYTEKHLHESCREAVVCCTGWQVEKSWKEFQQAHMKKENR